MEPSGSASVSGTYPGYEGYYNFFNYGSNDTGDPIANGLEFAKEKGWTNPYKSILGGAQLIGTSYINAGQNTSYFFKFDVVGDTILKASDGPKNVSTTSFFSHQYMTNIMDPFSQSSSVYNIYAANGNLDASLNFIIPVYENMPEKTTMPTRFTEDDGELYYASNTLQVRDYTNYDSPVVYTLSKGEIVRMIGRKATTAEGVEWDRVELENGWNCWVESSGLTPCTTRSAEIVLIDTTKLEIKVTPTATIKDILDKLNCKDYSILDSKGNVIEKENEKIATGYKIKVQDKTYTFIKAGDVNGDSQVDVIDLALLKRHLMETEKLNGNGYQAGILQREGKEIDVIDLALLKRVLMGTTTISF